MAGVGERRRHMLGAIDCFQMALEWKRVVSKTKQNVFILRLCGYPALAYRPMSHEHSLALCPELTRHCTLVPPSQPR
jgi:hypothetical protein